jgi:hypothetical protein
MAENAIKAAEELDIAKSDLSNIVMQGNVEIA